jgi:2-polyprenyl-3-methyl-5-hydroxy-6-metoxy-1,4-benzoquinol methylase
MAPGRIACPICAGRAHDVLYPGTIAAPAEAPAAYFSSSRTRRGHLPIVRCQGCGLVMSNPQDDAETLRRVYAALEDRAHDADEPSRQRSARDQVALVDAHVPRRGRLLDVGCSTGIFVAEAARAGWRVAGAESSAWAVARARARCPEADIAAVPLEGLDPGPAPFDAITLWDVLEHVPAPAAALSRLRQWLAPEGRLFLSVPNADSLVARTMGRHWVLLLREHLWYFSPATLGALLRGSGLELVAWQPKLIRASLAGVLRQVATLPAPLAAVGALGARVGGLERVAVRFPIGEMYAVARQADPA